MATVEDTINTLKEMGFPEEKAKKALAQTGWNGVESAMEWLLAHQEDADEAGDLDVGEGGSAVAGEAAPLQEAPKVLTQEEKKEQLAKLEALRVKKRKEREERDKQEQQERERRRVIEGKAITSLKKELEEKELKKIAEERRREKMETLRAKERVKAQIAADRAAKKEQEALERGLCVEPKPPTAVAPSHAVPPPRNYDETRIQIKQTDGNPLVQTFKAKEPLSAVRLFVQLNRKDLPGSPAKLMMTFPRKTFSESDYEIPLETLGLVPSASLVITK